MTSRVERSHALGSWRCGLLLCVLALWLQAAFFATPSVAVPPRDDERLNVLFIAVDDLRTSLGCYGDPWVQSPHIDRFAQTARIFTAAYCQQAVCGPSRTSVLTGRLPDTTHVWHNRNHFRRVLPELVTLPQLFQRHGYHAQAMGKILSGEAREDDPPSWSVPTVLRAPGWQTYALPASGGDGKKGLAWEAAEVPDEGYADGRLAALAVATLDELAARQQPFFLAVGFFKPHLPFCAPRRYWDLYDREDFALEQPTQAALGAPAEAYPDHLELGGYRRIPDDERVSSAQARRLRHGYYACVSYVDAQVGKVLDALDRLDLARRTIVVLWGDHGYSLGEAAHWCKDTNFELDTHVPLLIRTPGMPHAGASAAGLVQYVDIYPTLAALTGLEPPADLDGRSFAALLTHPAAPARDFALSQFSRPFKPGAPQVMGYSIRTADHRYTRWIDWASHRVLAEELYDYTAPRSVERRDAHLIERRNVASEPHRQALLEQLRAKLDSALDGG